MRKNELYRAEGTIYRILDIQQEDALVIDCKRMTMPKWVKVTEISESGFFPENELFPELGFSPISEKSLTAEQSKVSHERFTIIADILPHIGNKPMRNHLVAQAAESNSISRRTVTNYLCQYLVYQSIAVLTPQVKNTERELTQDEKNIRWALNKFFYTHHKNSLKTAYTMMLKEKYRDGRGILLQNYPSFDQFRYFYRKHNKMQTYYISRNGLKNYQRNDRPLLGDGVQAFAPSIGVGMLDSTVCDIYLVDDAGKLVGRPLLTACVDAFSGLCCGYSLSWEGGNYSLRGLTLFSPHILPSTTIVIA